MSKNCLNHFSLQGSLTDIQAAPSIMERDASYKAPQIAQSRTLDNKKGSLQESSGVFGCNNTA